VNKRTNGLNWLEKDDDNNFFSLQDDHTIGQTAVDMGDSELNIED
jgi:hypothetical protein